MKILYVGTERDEAQAIATAVKGLAEHVKVSWTSGLDRVAQWIDENDGLRVLIVEAQPNLPVWRSVLTYASGLPAALPVVIIVPEGIASDAQPLALDAHVCVARNPALLHDLPAVIARAIDHARQRQLERATREMVHEQFREAAIEVERARLRHASAVADAERLARREAELSVQLDSATRALGVLERRLADAETALHAGEEQAAEERREVEDTLTPTLSAGTAAEQLHESAVTAAAAQYRELQAGLSAARQELDAAEAALLEANARTTRERMVAAKQAAEREALEEQIRQERAARAALEGEIADIRAALAEARREHQSAAADVVRLIEREAVLTSELTDAHAALQDEQQRHDVALKAAASELAERLAHFERVRVQAEVERGGLTARLRQIEEARDLVLREHQSAIADVARLTERKAELERSLNEQRVTRDALEQAVAVTAAALQDEQQRHGVALRAAASELAERLAHFERVRVQAEGERDSLSAQLREIEEARDHALREHQSAVADVMRLMEREAELESRLNEERATRDGLEQAVAVTSAALQDEQQRHGVAVKAAANELAERLAHFERVRVQAEAERGGLTTQCRDYERRLAEAEDLKSTLARQLAALENDIEQFQHENHRLFEQSPLPMFRCTKDRVLTQANRTLTTLIGCDSADELRGTGLAATFESPNDLSWLIERCLGSKGMESTETTWHRQDGSRLLVRLSAFAISSDLIECGVEDLTPIRVLNDRLSQAHRMEAVGRLATEVAVTCSSLLGGIHQNVQQWLMDGSDPASRQGEMLLEEISRAAGLLRQLAVYGDEESRRPAVVELSAVVRDVAPVLKRVAGDGVRVQLPAACAPLNVDAGAERVKRLLVNLAAYGRERMPSGGRLKIELGTIVVDRHFAEKHPNVRLGPHALVTVTESRRAIRTGGPLQLHDTEARSSSGSADVQTGVDLGTLQELVAECGGHLWMTVEPVGDMVVEIRLPLVTSYGEPPEPPSVSGGRVRTLGNWFQR